MAIPKLQAYALPGALDIPPNKVNWAFEPERAALLIHDMQDYFVSFWGDNCPMMKQVIANIAALRQYCKEHNIPVYYTAQPKDQSDEDRALLNDMWGPGLTRSPEQQKIVDALAPDEADTVLVKWRYSAFHRSPLEQMLKETGRNHQESAAPSGVPAHFRWRPLRGRKYRNGERQRYHPAWNRGSGDNSPMFFAFPGREPVLPAAHCPAFRHPLKRKVFLSACLIPFPVSRYRQRLISG